MSPFSSTRWLLSLSVALLHLVVPTFAQAGTPWPIWPPQIGFLCPKFIEGSVCVRNRADYWIESTCLAENTTSLQVLVDFYYLTGNTDNYGALHEEGWLADCAYCSWYGVTCNDWGEVTELIVSEMDPPLTNKIPSQLQWLDKLQVLSLHTNRFWGQVPWELGYLYNLRRMELHYNILHGKMPNGICWIGGINGGGWNTFISADCGKPRPEFECQIRTCCDACYVDWMKDMDPAVAAILASQAAEEGEIVPEP